MRRFSWGLAISSLSLSLSGLAHASLDAPPSLPEPDAEAPTQPAAGTPPATGETQPPAGGALPAPDAGTEPAPAAGEGPAGGEAGGSASGEVGFGTVGGGEVAGQSTGEAEGASKRDRRSKGDTGGGDDAADKDNPRMVRGRREPVAQTLRTGVGLFHTNLADFGGPLTFRFRIHTDFFRREGFIYESASLGPDEHARVRGGVNLGFTPFKYGELFFSINSQANRNSRNQPGRQDTETIFALGDLDFGGKFGYRFKDESVGLAALLGLGLLNGADRLITRRVNFWFDVLFDVDIRPLTKKHVPFRFSTNIGFMLDNSLKLVDWEQITDPTSREVTRFALGVNHNRVRMRYAIDFPVRFGKERQFGIDPIVEWSWDVATKSDDNFIQEGASDSPLKRSSQWVTLGVRANVVSGLQLGLGIDIGVVSPNFELGPPVPPWQMILGLAWSFDPKPVIKEVEAEAPPAPPPEPKDGRILGTVTDPSGTAIADAKITFPGVTTTAILTDQNGSFTSFKFPAGPIPIRVEVGGQVLAETTAEVQAGEDIQVPIQLEKPPAPPTGVIEGAFTDAQGNPIRVTMKVAGQGVDEPFNSTEGGLIAIELYAGDYSAVVSAEGFNDKSITFTVPEQGNVKLTETLEASAPPDTPNIRASKNRIRTRKKLRYKGTAVSTRSEPMLDELAAYLNYHSEIELIEIGVHTDDRGAAKRRSQDRAESVKAYLVGKGVSPDRINTRGHGAKRPIAVNMTKSGRAKNNRTEIKIKQRK